MPNTPPVTPLPVAVELAREIADGDYLCDEAKAATIIDARIRPLVEALQLAAEHMRPDRSFGDEATQESLDRHNAAMQIVDAALRSAGAE